MTKPIRVHVGRHMVKLTLEQAVLLIDALQVQYASLKVTPGWVGDIYINGSSISAPIQPQQKWFRGETPWTYLGEYTRNR